MKKKIILAAFTIFFAVALTFKGAGSGVRSLHQLRSFELSEIPCKDNQGTDCKDPATGNIYPNQITKKTDSEVEALY